MRRVETVRNHCGGRWKAFTHPSAGLFSLLLSVGMIFRDKEGIQTAVFKTNNRTMMWQGDLILGLERASLQSHLLVFLWIISALVLKRWWKSRFPTNTSALVSHRFDFHVLACFSNYFLPHSVFISPPLLIYWRMLSQRSLLTTCRLRQVCWWRRFTQAQWYNVTDFHCCRK